MVCIASTWEPKAFSSTGEPDSSELTAILDESFVGASPASRRRSLGSQAAGYEGVEMVRLPHGLCSGIGEEAWE